MSIWLVSPQPPAFEGNHQQWAERTEDVPGDFYLLEKAQNWQLCDKQLRFPPLGIDFSDAHYRFRGGTEYLPRALKGLSGASVADVTAGWGRDSWLLAYRGFQVHLFERNPYLAFLLEQAVARAQNDPQLAQIAQRMTVHPGDARETLNDDYDVIYLDPMYPNRRKQAKVKKHMQALHALLGGEENDGGTLLAHARQKARKRVVVKRPQGAPVLSAEPPHHHIDAPNTRFDVYLPLVQNLENA